MIRIPSLKSELILKIENLVQDAKGIVDGVDAKVFIDQKKSELSKADRYIAIANTLIELLKTK